MIEKSAPSDQIILVVDDEVDFRELAVEILSRPGTTVYAAGSGEEALTILAKKDVDVALIDFMMPGMTGLELFREIKKLSKATDVIFITGHASVDAAVDAMKEGAYDYITKPVQFEELENCLRRLFELRRLRKENQELKAELKEKYSIGNLIAHSPAMGKVMEKVGTAIQTDLPVLVVGEHGSGKEHLARIIHENSQRRERPFIPHDCSLLDEKTQLYEWFGRSILPHEKAVYAKLGVFRSAQKGSVYLKKFDALSPSLQQALLDFLKRKSFIPVDGNEPVSSDVRLFASSSIPIERLREDKHFLPELLDFFATFEIQLPPLRERLDDLQPLLEHFLRQEAESSPVEIESSVIQVLNRYSWPGNIKELAQLAEMWRADKSLTKITVGDLPRHILKEVSEQLRRSGNQLKPLRQVEREAIVAALIFCDWDLSKAASILEIQESELQQKISELEIRRK